MTHLLGTNLIPRSHPNREMGTSNEMSFLICPSANLEVTWIKDQRVSSHK